MASEKQQRTRTHSGVKNRRPIGKKNLTLKFHAKTFNDRFNIFPKTHSTARNCELLCSFVILTLIKSVDMKTFVIHALFALMLAEVKFIKVMKTSIKILSVHSSRAPRRTE